MHRRLFCTLYPSFSPNWTAHISSKWTHKLYSTHYQTKPVTLSLHVPKKQQTECSSVFPVTVYQQAPKLHPKCAYKKTSIVDVSEVSSPEQFTFVLQLAVIPIIQLKIPPHLSTPTELKFEKERLTPEEITEENCCNLILP